MSELVLGLAVLGAVIWWLLRKRPASPAVRPPERAPARSGPSPPRRYSPEVPRERRVELPEADEDDAGWGEPDVMVHRSWFIEYQDASFRPTGRRISVRGLSRKDANSVYIWAWCHEREARRTFISSRLISLTDLETGELMEPANGYVKSLYGEPLPPPSTPEDRAAAKKAERYGLAVLVLVYVAKSDGRMVAVERKVLLDQLPALLAASGARFQDARPVTDDSLRQMRCDHDAFLAAVATLRNTSDAFRVAIVKAAEAVMNADGKIAPGEQQAIDWLKQELTSA